MRPVGFVPLTFALLAFVMGSLVWAQASPRTRLEEEVRAGRASAGIEAARKALAADRADVDLARALQDALAGEGRAEEAAAIEQAVAPELAPYFHARRLPPAEALGAYATLEERADLAAWLDLDRARALRAAGDVRKAERILRDHVKAHPSAEGWELLGLLDLDQGSPFGARRSLEKALELDPGRPAAIAALAEALWDPEEPGASREVIEKALARHPKSPVLLLAQIDDHLRRSELDAALAVAAPLAETRPKDVRVLQRLAFTQRKVEHLEDAEKTARLLLELDPGNARGLLTLGFVQEKRGEFEAALEQYLEAAAHTPDSIEAWVSVAFVHVLQGNRDYAERALAHAFDLDDGDPGAHWVAGLMAFFDGDNREARSHFKKVLKEQPDHLGANRAMGYALLADGRSKDAIEHFETVLRLDPKDAASVRMTGRALLEIGKADEALEAFHRAIALDEKDPWIRFDLGTALEETGEYDAAKEAYEKAIELDPTFAWPHLNLAEILEEVDGNGLAAVDHFQRFLDLGGPDPGYEIAQRISAIKNR